MRCQRASGIPSRSTSTCSARSRILTDGQFLRIACEVAGEPQLLDGIHVISADGAGKVIVQAVLAQAATSLPVVAILDADDAGRDARSRLEDFGWSKTREIIGLASWPGICNKSHDVEIEDLIPGPLAEKIIERLGESDAVTKKLACGRSWHYSFTEAWKSSAVKLLPGLMKAEDATELLWLARELNKRIDKIASARAKTTEVRRSQQSPDRRG